MGISLTESFGSTGKKLTKMVNFFFALSLFVFKVLPCPTINGSHHHDGLILFIVMGEIDSLVRLGCLTLVNDLREGWVRKGNNNTPSSPPPPLNPAQYSLVTSIISPILLKCSKFFLGVPCGFHNNQLIPISSTFSLTTLNPPLSPPVIVGGVPIYYPQPNIIMKEWTILGLRDPPKLSEKWIHHLISCQTIQQQAALEPPFSLQRQGMRGYITTRLLQPQPTTHIPPAHL